MTYSLPATATATGTTTMTEARVRAVMQKVAANLTAFVVAGHLTKEIGADWAADLTYLQLEEALEFFEVQLTTPGGVRFGIRYTVSSDGSCHQDSASGGLDIYGLPAGTHAGLYAHLRTGAQDYVRDHLAKRGWGFNGTKLDGAAGARRAFSRDGYGVIRETIGTWP